MDADIDDGGIGMESNFDKMGRKKGQQRGADGKFESLGKGKMSDEFDFPDLNVGGSRNDLLSKKKSKASKIMSIGGAKNDPFEAPPKKRARGRPSGTGHVANVFYEPQPTPASQDSDFGASNTGGEMMHTGKYFGVGIHGGLDSELSRQESE